MKDSINSLTTFALVAVPIFLPTECLLKFVSTFPRTDALAS
jgi:hypothetical protein